LANIASLSVAYIDELRRIGGNSTKETPATRLLPQKLGGRLLPPFVPLTSTKAASASEPTLGIP
jgi:hypothetical protein